MTHQYRIHSESDRQLLKQGVFKQFKLLLGRDNLFKLPPIILIKFRAAHNIGLQLILSLLIADLLAILDPPLPIPVSLHSLPLLVPLLFPDVAAVGARVEFLAGALA